MNHENHIFRVRELRLSDADSLFTQYSGAKGAATYISSLPHANPAFTRQRIKHWQKAYTEPKPNLCVYGVASVQDDAVFGVLVFVFKKAFAEIHFGISPNYSGQGIATKLCEAGLHYLKSLGVKEVRTQPYVAHQASIRVLEKSGFLNHGVIKEHAPFPALGLGLFDCADMQIRF